VTFINRTFTLNWQASARIGSIGLVAVLIFGAVFIIVRLTPNASALVEISMPAGEYSVGYPSEGTGPDLSKIMEDYGAAHPDREVHAAGNIVVIDQNGNAKFFAKVQYSGK